MSALTVSNHAGVHGNEVMRHRLMPMETSPLSETQRWISETEERIMERYEQVVRPLLDPKKRSAHDVGYDDAFPINKEMDERLWQNRGAIWVADTWDCFQTTVLLNGVEVPDWLYGYLSVDNDTCLPEGGSNEEVKDGIFAVLEDSAQATLRKAAQVLDGYGIKVMTSEVDLVDKRLSIHCHTDRPVMQVNGIMGNKNIRQALPPRTRICVNTFVEPHRRTDSYLEADKRPTHQVVTREFYYENGTLVRSEPQHWSAGMKYEPGDIINIGSIAFRVEEERSRDQIGREEFNPGRDIAELRRVQRGTAFQPGERANWHRTRHR